MKLKWIEGPNGTARAIETEDHPKQRIAIEGIDGSGKTSVTEALAKHLGKQGLKTMTFAPYRIANKWLRADIYDLWSTMQGSFEATSLLKDVIYDCEDIADTHKADVVIYDRHWMTGQTMVEGHSNREDYWHQYGPRPIPTALLRVPIETAMERRAEEVGYIAYMTPNHLGSDAATYARLAKENPQHILGIYRSDDDVTPAAIAKTIAWDMNIRR